MADDFQGGNERQPAQSPACETATEQGTNDGAPSVPSSYEDFFAMLHSGVDPAANSSPHRLTSEDIPRGRRGFDVAGSGRVPSVDGEEMLEGEVVLPGDGCVQRTLIRDELLHVPGVVSNTGTVVRLSRIQQWFMFCGVQRADAEVSNQLDGVLLSCSSVQLLLSASLTWTREDLRAVGGAHGLFFTKRATKKDMIQSLTIDHRCTPSCVPGPVRE